MIGLDISEPKYHNITNSRWEDEKNTIKLSSIKFEHF